MDRKPRLRCDIHWMVRRNLHDVARIAHECFDDAWSSADAEDFASGPSQIIKVATRRRRVVGYIAFEQRPHRYHVHSIAVDPAFWRHGIGSALIGDLFDKLQTSARTAVSAAVPETNSEAHRFLRAVGMRAIRVLPGAAPDGRDAYQFAYRLRVSKSDSLPEAIRQRLNFQPGFLRG